MSSAITTASPHLDGNGVVPPEAQRIADFYDKLLQLRDEVFAGKHPRIHLPPTVLEQVAPCHAQNTPPFSSKPTTNGTPSGSHSSHPLPPRPESSLQHYPPPTGYSSPAQNAQRPFTAKSTSSGIDPVLLTKSDHLIRAELQLKRQQLERGLKDQLDKKAKNGDKEVPIDDGRFDVEQILTKAQELVKPLSGLQVTANSSEGSESFDENSYYSSQANSWSSEEVDSNQNSNGAYAADARSALEAQLTTANSATRSNAQPKQADTTIIDLDEEYEPADDIEIYEPPKAHEEQEESEYSPPPADIGPVESSKGRGRDRGSETYGGMNGYDLNNSPSSSLLSACLHQDDTTVDCADSRLRSSRRQSPIGHPPPVQNPRKRRREEKRRQHANKRVARSPEPYIKEEPQSPPPFASYSDPQPSKRRALQTLSSDVEVVGARDGRTQPVYYREQESGPRAYRQYEEPLSPTVIRVPQRRLERDDQDLRRVASLQYARRPYSPGAEPLPFSASETRHVRAASHAFVDRSMGPVYREASVRPSAASRYIRERSRSPVHEYLPRAQSPMIMAPPRRIVVDQYGNKYYAAPVDVRESVAPPSRRIEAEPYFERALTREPTMRAPLRADPYEEDDAQRMPPPPPRRYVDPLDAEVIETRPMRQREISLRPVDADYPSAREVIERRPVVQYEEMGPPREYVPTRAYSVRPEVVRREVPGEYAPVRHESVQPGYMTVAAPRYREVSAVHQDPYDDRPRYGYAAPSQGRRYADEGVVERPVEVAQEPYAGEARRVTYRY
ncbi:hypothetical protein K469DRAFT_735188 [Zopfia rhizophila CBS 207.26]|uniref:Uncharacterized protein n=1 Tax=Zopfia rhizophila CBS 207.26 TaxID=1314779 RepID=A0A6A6EQC9_9PEZI|nr:hypothetical protein K469DRAFT_735188 [Zopfia rhizophila CBS 207.26]